MVVAAGVYRLYRDTTNYLAAGSGLFRLIYAAVLIVATLPLAKVAINNDIDDAYHAFEYFETVWSLGLMVFGLHLASLGCLVIQSRFMTNPLGWLLIGAGISYLLDNGAGLSGLELIATHPLLVTLMTLGEFAFALWLLLPHVKNPNN